MIPSVLITGGSGYIGSHCAWQLVDQGITPVILDNLATGHQELAPPDCPTFHVSCGDTINLVDILKTYKINTVFHLAASLMVEESHHQPAQYYANNVGETANLLQACLATGVKNLVFSSSAAVYGQVGKTPVQEEQPCQPINPYGRTKLACEWLINDMVAAGQLNAVILRYFNVAGADEHTRTGESPPVRSHLLKRVCERLANPTKITQSLTIYGNQYPTPDGTCIRDYLHVSDVATAHWQALDYLINGGESVTVNLGTGMGASVLEVINAANQLANTPLEIAIGPPRPGDPPISIADGTLAKQVLGWQPEHSTLSNMLATGLRWEISSKAKQLAQQLL